MWQSTRLSCNTQSECLKNHSRALGALERFFTPFCCVLHSPCALSLTYRSRIDTLPRPTIFLCMISLIKNALWPVTLQALCSQIIGNVWRHPKIALCGPLQPMSGYYLGLRMRYLKVEIYSTSWWFGHDNRPGRVTPKIHTAKWHVVQLLHCVLTRMSYKGKVLRANFLSHI